MMGAGVMRWGGAALALAGVLCVAGGIRGASGQAGVTVGMAPPSMNISQNSETFEVDVNVQNVSNLGAYELVLTFNPDVLEYVSAYDGGFLSSTGRNMTCFGYEAPAATFNEWKAIHLGCGTNGLISGGQGKAGPSGSATLATIQFKPKAAGASNLVFEGLGEAKYYFGAPDPSLPAGAKESGQTGLAAVEVCSPCQELSISFSEGTGVVQVTAPGQATPTALAPTPTREPRDDVTESEFRKTVEAAVGTPTNRLSTQTAGATGSIAGDNGSGSGTSGVAGSSAGGGNASTSGAGGAGGRLGPDGVPIAGYGPQQSEPSPWWVRTGVGLLVLGLVVLAGGLARQRPATVRGR